MEVKLEQFTGPLHLLQTLIAEKKMNISEVALSAVTEQFLRWLDQMEERDADEIADFLVIAAKLLLLKSKTLLPQLLPEEEEGPSLADQLRLYQRFVEVSRQVNRLWEDGRYSAPRVEPPRVVVSLDPFAISTRADLKAIMLQLVARLNPQPPLPQTTIDRAISLKGKIENIRQLLRSVKSFSFFGTVASRANRTDLIVGFLALLELFKQQVLGLQQQGTFGDIVVKKMKMQILK